MMNCPYCGKAMEQGVIQSAHEISWKKKPTYFNRAKFCKNSVILSGLSIWRGSKVIAYLCRSCEKILIDYSYGKCDANYNK